MKRRLQHFRFFFASLKSFTRQTGCFLGELYVGLAFLALIFAACRLLSARFYCRLPHRHFS